MNQPVHEMYAKTDSRGVTTGSLTIIDKRRDTLTNATNIIHDTYPGAIVLRAKSALYDWVFKVR